MIKIVNFQCTRFLLWVYVGQRVLHMETNAKLLMLISDIFARNVFVVKCGTYTIVLYWKHMCFLLAIKNIETDLCARK